MVSYRSSSPRLTFPPLNPSPTGYTPRSSPVAEMSDTLSPLRERLDPGLVSPQRSSPTIARPHTSSSSRSRSPERSPLIGTIPLQPHHAYAHHPSPSGSPFAQGIAFSSSSPLSSPPLATSPQSSVCQNACTLSPSHSPVSVHSTNSRSSYLLRSPSQTTASRFNLAHNSPVQIISSPSRYTRTQSLIQQSLANPYSAQLSSSPPESFRTRRVSLGAESCPRQSIRRSPILVNHPFIQDTSTAVKGNSTPPNEAPVRQWGGRRGWVGEWDNVAQHPDGACAYVAHSSGHELAGVMGMGVAQHGYWNPVKLQESFGRGVGCAPGAFLDEEIRASFYQGIVGVDTGFTEPSAPGIAHVPMGINTCYRMDGIPVSRAIPTPVEPGGGTRSRTVTNCGKMEAEPASIDGGSMKEKTPDNLTYIPLCPMHFHRNTDGFTPDGASSVKGGLRGSSRRFSDTSTHSSMSYASCLSGLSQSESQSFLVSPSQSYTSAYPSLGSLGIGIEEAEREVLRSRTIWRRRNSGSTTKRHRRGMSNGNGGNSEDVGQGCRCSQSVGNGERGELTCLDGPEGGHVRDVKVGHVAGRTNADLKQPSTQTHEKDTVVKHGSSFFRVALKHGDITDEHAQLESYKRAEKYVSLAITSILPVATITMLSPVGEALVKVKDSAKYIGQELGPVLKDTLSVSSDILSLVPLPGLEEAAKALLCVWDSCQKVDTNRLSCLRLAERCATLLYSVRCEINEVGVETTLALAEPVEKLSGALSQIRTFLDTQLHRPFLKRYMRREEITRELAACNQAITDAASRFGISVQIRTYHEVCSAVRESKRFALEAQAILSLDHQMMQRHYAMMVGPQIQTQNEVVTGFPSGNALGLIMVDDTPVSTDEHLDGTVGSEHIGGGGGGCSTPPPTYGPPLPTASKSISTGFRSTTPTLSILVTGCSDATDSTVTTTPTPTRATFLVDEAGMKTAIHPTFPMHALAQVHRAQDTVDTAADEAALRGTLAGVLDAHSDVEMVQFLQVARGEFSEAVETLRQMLKGVIGVGVNTNERATSDDVGAGLHKGNAELDRKFIQSGIEAMTKLTGGVGAPMGFDGSAVAIHPLELPSWTITRSEVVRTHKIGTGFFSDVYLGHWWKHRVVVIKTLAHNVSREAFVRYVELWNTLDHPNVLPLYGASSTEGENPWFFVSKFCSGGNLVSFLKCAKVGNKDLLRNMHEIAKGMAYLHECGVLHGNLRAANVLVNENGQCVLSDFGQCEMKLEAHQLCGRPEAHPFRWRAPEMLIDDGQPTYPADVYAFAICCVEILGVGDLPWETLDDRVIHDLVLDKDERPPIPVLAGYADVTNAVTNLVHTCWVREPDRRPTFSVVVASLENIRRLEQPDNPRSHRASTPVINTRLAPIASTESSPADEQYETASEDMTTEIEQESMDCMTDIPLTSPAPVFGHVDMVHSQSVIRTDTSDHTEITSTQVPSSALETRDTDLLTYTLMDTQTVDVRHEEIYRLIVRSNHAFHSSLTLPLWSPTRVEIGAVGYLSKATGEFVALFNAIDPLQSGDERLRRLPSMYGYGKFEVQKREDGKRSVAQRGLDAISMFLTFKSRTDRSHPERTTRQYAFPLIQGKPSAQLCVEKTVHYYVDQLEAPKTWFEQHVDVILEALPPRYGILRQDLILVVGTLDAPDWALFVSDDHSDGRAQFNVFSAREKGGPWGMYTMERAIKNGTTGPARWVDVGLRTFSSKVSCSDQDAIGDTVMLAGLRFERGMQIPTMM